MSPALRASSQFATTVLALFNLALTAALAAENSVQPAHKCIPPEGSSTIFCPKWGANPRTYCGSTRKGAVFWASNDSPIARAAGSVWNTDDYQVVRDVHSMIEDMANKSRQNLDKLFLMQNCSNFFTERKEWLRGSDEAHYISDEQWRWTNAQYIDARRIGLRIPDSHCFSAVKIPGGTPSRAMFKIMDKFSKVLNKTSVAVHERTQMGSSFFDKLVKCWTNLHSHMDGLTKTNIFNCRVMAVAGIRRDNGVFAIPVAFTNEMHHKAPAEGMRLYVVESWSVGEDDRLRTHRLPSFKRGDNSSVVNKTTTSFSTWGGRTEITHFMYIPTNNGPAMRLVKQAAEKMVQNVWDSTTNSNIAILILPAALTLIPISCVEYVAKTTLIANILLTDFLPVLPLAIKGVELIKYGYRSQTGCASYSVGTENPKQDLATVEIWCAQCKMQSKIVTYGIVLFSLAVLFMFLGIAIELGTYRSLRNRIKDLEERREPPSWWLRPAVRQYIKRGAVACSECTCDVSYSSLASFRNEGWWDGSGHSRDWWSR